MLLEFTCANFRSINHKCTLSLRAQGIADEPKNNVFQINKNAKVLKTAALYGANSSGKTNVVKAFLAMIYQVVESVRLNPGEKLRFEPFRLTTVQNNPTFLEAVFIVDNTTYRYGFEYNESMILGEWLYSSSVGGKREKCLFIRTEEGIGVNENTFSEGVGKEVNTDDNRLFLSLCAQLGGDISKSIITKFQSMNAISGIESRGYSAYSKAMLHTHSEGYDSAVKFFDRVQLGFDSIETKEEDFDESDLPQDMPSELKESIVNQFRGKKRILLFSKHNVYNKNGKVVGYTIFDIDEESEGTKKLIELSGPIFDTLANGKVLWVDELDAKMHPLISNHIVDLFNNPKTNPHNAQLIFSTHDTHLLSSKLLRRDQIWFTEKDKMEQTDLYNMMDIELPDGSKPRSDSNYERNYIAGRYGAVPFILND